MNTIYVRSLKKPSNNIKKSFAFQCEGCVWDHIPLQPREYEPPLLQQYITLSSSLISSHSVLNTLDSLQCSKKLQNKQNLLLLQFRSGIHLYIKKTNKKNPVHQLTDVFVGLSHPGFELQGGMHSRTYLTHIHGYILSVCPFSDLLQSIPHQGEE